jgi:predicted nucleic acid-binding Zn ribbon protein
MEMLKSKTVMENYCLKCYTFNCNFGIGFDLFVCHDCNGENFCPSCSACTEYGNTFASEKCKTCVERSNFVDSGERRTTYKEFMTMWK